MSSGDRFDMLGTGHLSTDVFLCVCSGERRREAWSGDRRRRWKVDGEESGRGRRDRGDEAEDGLRDVIYVQASKSTVTHSLNEPQPNRNNLPYDAILAGFPGLMNLLFSGGLI